MKKTLILILISLTQGLGAMSSGIYRLEVSTQYAKIPFLLEVDSKSKLFHILNSQERIRLTDLKTKKKGHLTLEIPPYDGILSLEMKGNNLKGLFIRASGQQLEVSGQKNPSLFPTPTAPALNFAGKWEVSTAKGEKNILLLEQEDKIIRGSYMTMYGDYRNFQGVVDGNTFRASSFDGVYNYLITGTLQGQNLKAQILANYQIELTGVRNPKASLPDPYKLTQMEKKMDFSFPNLSGKMVSLKDKEFENRPVIIQIFGSWCPNCIDELKYLIPWYEKNEQRGIRIIALSFERTQDLRRAQILLRKLSKEYGLNYPMLIAGLNADDSPEKKLPGLKNFKAFPTTIFLDKKHNVFKVHAGFNGPSTKEFYEEWQTEFNLTIDQLLK